MKALKTIPNLGLGYGWGEEADSEVGVGSLGSIASSKSYMPCPNSGLDFPPALFFHSVAFLSGVEQSDSNR